MTAARRVGERLLLVLMVALVVVVLASTASAIVETTSPSSSPSPAPVGLAVAAADGVVYPIVFPVGGDHSYTDSWGAPRSGGRSHKGADIFAAKGTPVVAAADGTVTRLTVGVRAGRFIEITHDGGWQTLYLHLNNDTEGTDDGARNEPAAGLEVGDTVSAGDVIDFVGDSGNAEETPPHLHFEIHRADGEPVNPYASLRAAEGRPVQVTSALAAAAANYSASDIEYLGHLATPLGFNADVTVHGGVAYMGTWGRPDSCPGTGVRVIDVSDPRAPEQLATIAAEDQFAGTSTDSVWVGALETDDFVGDLAVVAVRLCDTTERNRRRDMSRGLALFEVTNPAAPNLVGFFDSGENTQGVHEIDVVVRPDGSVLAAATVLQSYRHTAGESGDVRIIDISDPAEPVELADWDLRRDGPPETVAELMDQVHDELELHAHSATWAQSGYQLWIANWDAGAVLLDTADAENVEFVVMFGFDPESDGNAHTLTLDEEAGLMVRTDQDLVSATYGRHRVGWGDVHIYDISDLEAIVEVATFTTKRGSLDEDGETGQVDGLYSAHVAEISDGKAFVAWYSDGVRVIDLSNPAAPHEMASFVPPRRHDPQDYWDAPDGSESFALVWGIHVEGDYIYMSDTNSGLWIARYPIAIPRKEKHGAE